MEFLLIVGVVWLLSVIFGGSSKRKDSSTRASTNSADSTRTYRAPSNPTDNSSTTRTPPKQTFRPSATARGNSNINFKTSTSTASTTKAPTAAEISGLHDAFTGAPLDINLGLHQCQSCKVFYHTESLHVLREANNSQCVACHSTSIIAVGITEKQAGGANYTPNIVTLDNYKQHVGSVVTFEGRVHRVNQSRRGDDFAVMFENKSWTTGFKLVFFRRAVMRIGAPYINSLHGKKVKVRGLIVKHPRFGYEIIISQKSMILSVEQ